MKRKPIMFLILFTCWVSLSAAMPALAFPPLPSSFYGTVKVNGGNVSDGTLVRALINDRAYAQAHTQTYQGNSVYSLDVLGDDSSTTALEGGHEGDTIQFEVGGELASQKGTWHGGTNVRLDLSVSATDALGVLSPTPVSAPAPTANPQATVQATPKPAPACPGLGLAAVIVVAMGAVIWTARLPGERTHKP